MRRIRVLRRRATMTSLPSSSCPSDSSAVLTLSTPRQFVFLRWSPLSPFRRATKRVLRDRNGRSHVCASRHGYEAIERVDLLTLFLFSSVQRSQPVSSSAPYALPLVSSVLEAAADSATGLTRSVPCSYRSQILDGGVIVAAETGCSLCINRPPNPKHWAEGNVVHPAAC